MIEGQPAITITFPIQNAVAPELVEDEIRAPEDPGQAQAPLVHLGVGLHPNGRYSGPWCGRHQERGPCTDAADEGAVTCKRDVTNLPPMAGRGLQRLMAPWST